MPDKTIDKLVILDRDGVINRDSKSFVKNLDEWIPLPGAIEAIAKLYRAGYRVAVATNQSGIARGLITPDALEQMHAHLTALVAEAGGELARIEVCPHGPNDGCACRKPLPGMLLSIRDALGLIDLTTAWMVGDSLRDLQAGEAAGTRVALVLTGNGEETLGKLGELEHPERVACFASLADFADRLLAEH
ncbi:D-glycero-beta-D-manno-heptose 1,7-bisphosphate 7-phosphatase [Halotalea alkalilenta]|uniref:D-glycero-beta-D-manno-heptose 1,7-bisphosphate 7-phosphatase n=1 Tax=Halotalea alkalilenta TaxID=376489 RepID=UPI00048121C8|nr:D-glycero-beta-D-manno-heptose 1,7-bisphosphate 7-phosphatase [Halotalea alkalilenta]